MFARARLITLFALTVLSIFTFVDANPFTNKRTNTVEETTSSTNAQRFARGLGPLPPTRRFDSTRVARAVPSGAPGATQSGVLRVYDALTNNALGWVSPNLQLVNTLSDAVLFSFTQTSPGGYTNLFVPSQSSNLVAYAQTSTGQLGTTSANTLRLFTSGASYQTRTEINGYYFLSAMYSISSSTGRVTIRWFNDNSAAVPVYPLFNQGGNAFIYSGGPDFYRASTGNNYPTVYFVFE